MKTKKEKAKSVIEYYSLCNKLKDVERTGWLNWHVNRKRVESIGEHVYGVTQLAIAMWSEFDYDIDINKVVMMLSAHELEETIIGDLTHYQIDKKEKNRIGHEADEKILKRLNKGEYIKSIVFEFDERKTPEAKFAYMCDKLECDIQCKLYDEENTVDLNSQEDNGSYFDSKVQEHLKRGESWSEMWMGLGRENYSYDENFRCVSEYAGNHSLHNARKNVEESD